MLRRVTGLALLLAAAASLAGAADPPKPSPQEAAKAKRALQEVQDFMGIWNLEGTQKVGPRTEAWKEKVDWAWKFKTDVPTVKVTFGEGKGKYFAGGELTYAVAKKRYLLTLSRPDKSKVDFTGQLKVGALKMEGKDAKTGDVYRLTMNTVADGIRFALKVERQEGGKGPFETAFTMNGNKEGESLGAAAKKPECVVTGGLGKMTVSYNGKTYYVCCSGCREEFNANPKKYVEEYEKRKNK
jgi:ribosomal protein L24E